MRGRCWLTTLGAITALLPNRAAAQPSGTGFRPGGQPLFSLDLAGTPVGEIPSTIRLVDGNVEVVLKDGVRMLKAATASSFLITLPQVLPRDFTLEFDLIPKAGGPPPDLSIEGTPTINQGSGSAHLLWQADGYMAVIGGAQDNYEQPMPEELKAALPGVLTQVGVSVEGPTMKFYINGQRLYTLERQFARGRVLRVSLGGVSETNAVYLAGLRVATGAPVIAAGQDAEGGSQSSARQSQASTAAPTSVTGLVVTIDAQKKATLKWTAVPDAFGYAALRWKPSDLTCCKNLSPPGAASITEWLDGVLSDGTYAYRVYATTGTGTVFGETRVTVKQGTISEGISAAGSGTIASTAPPPPPPILNPSRPADPITPTSIMSNAPAATIAPITGTPSQAWLRWSVPSGAVNYVVWRREGTNAEEQRTATPITQSYFNDAITNPAVSYSYQVRAYQADGKWGNSAWVTFTPPAMLNPTGFVARQIGTGAVMLTWQKVDGASEYRLEGPGLPSGVAATPEVFLDVSGLPAGMPLSWKVVAVYGDKLFDPSTRPTASITLPTTPWRNVPYLSLRNGAGSLVDEIAYYGALAKSGMIPAWDPTVRQYPWEGMNAVLMIVNFPVDDAFRRLLGNAPSGRPGSPVYQAVFADMLNMGAGRHVFCTEVGIPPANKTLCWAGTHGPEPGTPGWGDGQAMLRAVDGWPNRGWTLFLREDTRGTIFAAFNASEAAGGYGSDQYSTPKPDGVFDTEGPKRLPHACLACHGGRYDPTSQKIVEASLIPIDPSVLAVPNRQGQEESIRRINMIVLNSNPSPAVAAYIKGLYRGTPEVPGTTADDNYVPTGWYNNHELYRKVVKPYCQGCHLQQTPRNDFASYQNFVTFKGSIQAMVCSERSMPHSEAALVAFWRDGKGESLPDYLMTTLELPKCMP